LLDYIEACIDELTQQFPAAHVVLAGDFNQIVDRDVEERTGLQQLVQQPTRGPSLLDRIFVSNQLYSVVRVISSVVKSDHKAIVAYASQPMLTNKSICVKTFRSISPKQHAQFLAYITTLNLEDVGSNPTSADVQQDFDAFYEVAMQLLE